MHLTDHLGGLIHKLLSWMIIYACLWIDLVGLEFFFCGKGRRYMHPLLLSSLGDWKEKEMTIKIKNNDGFELGFLFPPLGLN